MTNKPILNKKSKTYIYICEMFEDGVAIKHISNHLQVDKELVKLVLEEHFGSSVRKKGLPKKSVFILPNVANDVFLCQLALVANINQKTFYKFVETVRENYPDIFVHIQTGNNSNFYKTPNLDYETDLYIKSQD